MYTEIQTEREDTLAGVTYRATLPAMRHEQTGQLIFEDRTLERWERALAAAVAQGPVGGDALRFLRQWLGLKAQEVAALLQTTPETVSRWEKGKHPVEPNAFALIAQAARERLADREDTLLLLRMRANTAAAPSLVTLSVLV